MAGKLVIVYSRLPFQVTYNNGDLQLSFNSISIVNALYSVVKSEEVKTWIGMIEVPSKYPGEEKDFQEKVTPEIKDWVQNNPDLNCSISTVFISRDNYLRGYQGINNRVLWPVLHGLAGHKDKDNDSIKDVYLDIHFEITGKNTDENWNLFYENIEKFVSEIVNQIKSGKITEEDIIWCHDYHLVPLARMLKLRLNAEDIQIAPRIAGFFHVPFPKPDELRVIGRERAIQFVKDILCYNFYAFHTRERDLKNFKDCVYEFLGQELQDNSILRSIPRYRKEGLKPDRTFTYRDGQHSCILGAYPLGIDIDHFKDMVEAPVDRRVTGLDEKERVERINYVKLCNFKNLGYKIILAGARYDYSKGLYENLIAYEKFLLQNKNLGVDQKFVLVVIAQSTKEGVPEYNIYRQKVDEKITEINKNFADLVFMIPGFTQDKLVHAYKIADVIMITPINDGQNLMIIEAITCSDNAAFIVSKNAGAVLQITVDRKHPERRQDLSKYCYIVDPQNTSEVANTITQAISIDEHTRRYKLNNLKAFFNIRPIKVWQDKLLGRMRLVDMNYSDKSASKMPGRGMN